MAEKLHPNLMTVADAARLVGVGQRSIRTAIAQKEIDAIWLGPRRVYVLREPLLELLGGRNGTP